MSKINVSQICEVRVLGLRTNTQYEWREAKNSFWDKQEEGFYGDASVSRFFVWIEPVRVVGKCKPT